MQVCVHMGVCRDGVEHQSVHCTWLCAACLQVNVSVVCVCVHMAVCKAGAALVSSCTWVCKGMGFYYFLVSTIFSLHSFHRIIESLRLEKTHRIIQSNHPLITNGSH